MIPARIGKDWSLRPLWKTSVPRSAYEASIAARRAVLIPMVVRTRHIHLCAKLGKTCAKSKTTIAAIESHNWEYS